MQHVKLISKNKRAKLHREREAELRLTDSGEAGNPGRGGSAAAFRQHDSFHSRPLSDKTKSILTDGIKKSGDKTRSTLGHWTLNFTGR